MEKKIILNACCEQIRTKILHLQHELRDLEEGAAADAKSTAGDKHETGRAMMQLEQEKLSRQLHELNTELEETQKINADVRHEKIGKGSLVQTDKALFFIGAAPQKLRLQNQEIFVISLSSPIGQQLSGKQKGETFQVNAVAYQIIAIN